MVECDECAVRIFLAVAEPQDVATFGSPTR